ncbi:MAG: cation-transporting P-type ATPase, partial [Caldilinea sp.]|nr:cation-transporting P-type ATPase [Caldilinea sp.]MDW8442852.1 cation-transporting P-type ATPase [Caldilineaceae bacterium]
MNTEQRSQWHLLSVEAVIEQLRSDPAMGLTAQQVAELQAQVGPNELVERASRSPWRLLWEQFTATMVLILIAAGMISLFLQKWQEAVAIFAIVVLFGLLGFVQEYRAERAMAALK